MRYIHIECKPFCAPENIAPFAPLGDTLCMERPKNFLREYRKRAGLSLEAAGAVVGLSHGQLSRIERGLYPWNEDLLYALADVYECDFVDLLITDPDAPDQIIGRFRKATPETRQRIVAVADALLKESG